MARGWDLGFSGRFAGGMTTVIPHHVSSRIRKERQALRIRYARPPCSALSATANAMKPSQSHAVTVGSTIRNTATPLQSDVPPSNLVGHSPCRQIPAAPARVRTKRTNRVGTASVSVNRSRKRLMASLPTPTIRSIIIGDFRLKGNSFQGSCTRVDQAPSEPVNGVSARPGSTPVPLRYTAPRGAVPSGRLVRAGRRGLDSPAARAHTRPPRTAPPPFLVSPSGMGETPRL